MENKKILVTGHNSMIGRATVNKLIENYDVVMLERNLFDLTDSRVSETELPKTDCIIHLAGHNGGISYNESNPSDIYNKTVQMGINVINLAIKNEIKKIVFIVPSCALEPSNETVDENALFSGRPHPSVACHGMAKRAVVEAGKHWAKQHSGKFVTVICQNSMGPYDNFKSSGKVVSGLISKFVNAIENNLPEVIIWGTGEPKREFIYCKDVASGIVEIMEKYNDDRPLILNSGYEISIKDLALKIKDITGYCGDVVFDITKPDGQMRKSMCTKRTKELLDINFTDFDVALKETIDWYMESRKNEINSCNS